MVLTSAVLTCETRVLLGVFRPLLCSRLRALALFVPCKGLVVSGLQGFGLCWSHVRARVAATAAWLLRLRFRAGQNSQQSRGNNIMTIARQGRMIQEEGIRGAPIVGAPKN